MTDRAEMIIRIQVTEPQALAINAMFKYWTLLGNIGSSRKVVFYVDGDGDFQPNAKIDLPDGCRKLTPDLESMAVVGGASSGNLIFDFDSISAQLHQGDEDNG